MIEEWLEFLRDNHPDHYADAMRSVNHSCKWRDERIAALEAEKKELQNYIEQLRILYGCRDGCDGCLWCVSRGWLSGNNPDQEPKK